MKKVFKVYTDPSHGWIAVKFSVLDELGISDKITPYSYMKGATAYLEEDCDAAILVKALKANNIEYEFKEQKYYEFNCPIRNYVSYNRCGSMATYREYLNAA